MKADGELGMVYLGLMTMAAVKKTEGMDKYLSGLLSVINPDDPLEVEIQKYLQKALDRFQALPANFPRESGGHLEPTMP